MIGLGQFTHRGVLGAGGDAVIVERIPFDVQNVSSVARHSRVVRVHFTCLAKHKHTKKHPVSLEMIVVYSLVKKITNIPHG